MNIKILRVLSIRSKVPGVLAVVAVAAIGVIEEAAALSRMVSSVAPFTQLTNQEVIA